MGEVVTLPIRPGTKIVRLMRPEPRQQVARIDLQSLEVANHAYAAVSMAMQIHTNIQHGGCITERDADELMESLARGFIEAHLFRGAPTSSGAAYDALLRMLTQPDGGPSDAA